MNFLSRFTSTKVENNTPIKIALLGDGSTGKTSFFERIKGLNDDNYKFRKKYIATTNFNLEIIELPTNIGKVQIHLWDTAGQEKYGGDLRSAYIYGSNAAIIMYDITNRNTIKNVNKWIVDIKDVCGNIPVIVTGNKLDQRNKIPNLELVKLRNSVLQSQYNSKNIQNMLISVRANNYLINDNYNEKIEYNGILAPIEQLLSMYFKRPIKIN